MRAKSTITLAIPLAVVGLLAAGLAVYSYIRKDTVPDGVSVGGVHIGGLNRDAAVERLRERMLPTLRRPVTVTHGDRVFTLGPRESRVAADLEASVDAAIKRGRGGFFAITAVRDLAGIRREREVEPVVHYSENAVDRLMRRVRKGAEHAPIDARLHFDSSGFELVKEQKGVKLDRDLLRDQVVAAVTDPKVSHRLTPRATYTKPKIRLADLASRYPTLIVVNRSKFKLTLYKNLKPRKTYGIAVGRAGLETPTGTYTVQNKAINPAWHVPNSDWAGKLKGKVIAGDDPKNPIKARWMGLYDGVGIHGTAEPDSIGSNASHGCIRMKVPEVEELYDEVPIGTEVYIS